MSTIAPPNASTQAKAGKPRSLLRSIAIGLALAAVAYAICVEVIQAVASGPAGDPAKREKHVLFLVEPAKA